MSRRNGDRARFQKERKRKMLRRQRVQDFINSGGPDTPATAAASTPAASAPAASTPAARKGSPRKGAAVAKTGAAPAAAAAKA